MLSKRLAAGFSLAFAVALMLVIDARLAPYFPALLLATATVGTCTTLELRRLIAIESRPPIGLAVAGVVSLLAANWIGPCLRLDPWRPVMFTLAAGMLIVYGRELVSYNGRGGCTSRISGLTFTFCYLGVMPSFLLQIRWLDTSHRAELMLLATVIAAKTCDIGAYTIGRLIGRTPLAPTLSPNKTREGFLGGILFAAISVILLELALPLFRNGIVEAALFGAVVGIAGAVGDLTESMFKRDAHAKDAGTHIPGFGGVLDVFDSLIFAGPVAYGWFAVMN